MVFFQAAMLAYPENFMAANDLGVLLAQCGNYADARAMLEHSLSLSPAIGHLAQPGRRVRPTGPDVALARRADQQAAMLQQAEVARRRTSHGSGQRVRSAGSIRRRSRRPRQCPERARRGCATRAASGQRAGRATALAGRRRPSCGARCKRPSAAERHVLGLTGIPTLNRSIAAMKRVSVVIERFRTSIAKRRPLWIVLLRLAPLVVLADGDVAG